jgi:hypothetical protein
VTTRLLTATLAAAGALWVLLVRDDATLLTLAAAPIAALLAPVRARAAAPYALAAAAGVGLARLGAGPQQAALDVLVALTVATPAAAAFVALRSRRSILAPAAVPAAPVIGSTRRSFLVRGAAGSAAVAGITARVAPAALAAPEPFRLTITEGEIPMVDGTPVFFRGFRRTDATDDRPTIPGPAIGNVGPGIKGRDVFEGEQVVVVLKNDTPRTHWFLIERTANEEATDPVVGPIEIAPNQTKEIAFTAPAAGTYIYRDANRNNRLLGMYGAFIVLPAGVEGRLLPYAPAPGRVEITAELRTQLAWVLSNVDPVLGELARRSRRESRLDYPLSQVVPRYFLINGETGVNATLNNNFTVPVVPLQSGKDAVAGVLIRCINTGVCTHSLHWHGNHVFPVERNGVPERAGLVFEKDVQRMEPLNRVAVILPAHTGYDAFPPLNDKHPKADVQHFPMHCHAEMSQTAAGGSYPFGMLTDWHLTSGEHTAEAVRRELAEQRADGRRAADPDEVQAAIDDRTGNSGKGRGRGRGGKDETKDADKEKKG